MRSLVKNKQTNKQTKLVPSRKWVANATTVLQVSHDGALAMGSSIQY